MRIWEITPNKITEWDQSLIKIIDGKRISEDFINNCEINDNVKSINIKTSEESMNYIIKSLELTKESYANTMTLVEDATGIIQFCYQQDFIESRMMDNEKLQNTYNYFASITNNDISYIFGNVIYFKVDSKNNLIDLTPTDLFGVLASIYYVSTFQVRDGDLYEITLLNSIDYIESMFKDMNCNKKNGWEFYLPKSNNSDMEELGIDLVDITDYNNLIILKQRDVNDISEKYKNTDRYARGVYQDLNEYTIKQLFTLKK